MTCCLLAQVQYVTFVLVSKTPRRASTTSLSTGDDLTVEQLVSAAAVRREAGRQVRTASSRRATAGWARRASLAEVRRVGRVVHPGSARAVVQCSVRSPLAMSSVCRVLLLRSACGAHRHRTWRCGSGSTSAGRRRRRGRHGCVSGRVPVKKTVENDDRAIATVSLLIFSTRPFWACGRGARVRFCPPRVGVEGRGWVLWRPAHPQSMYGAEASVGSRRGSARGSEW